MIRACFALIPLLLATAAAPARQAPATDPARPIAAATSWEHAGSDIPADPAWRTGTLPNAEPRAPALTTDTEWRKVKVKGVKAKHLR